MFEYIVTTKEYTWKWVNICDSVLIMYLHFFIFKPWLIILLATVLLNAGNNDADKNRRMCIENKGL